MSAARRFDPSRYEVLWAPFAGMQTRFVNAAEFEVFGGGSKGPGKSAVLLAAGTRQIHKPRYKALITRETGPQLEELIESSHRLFPKMGSKPHWRGDLRRWKWPSGASLKFEAIGTQDDVNRIQGKEWSYVGQDEVANLPDERVVDLVQAEIRCPDPTVIRMWRGSGNPGKAGHGWVKRRFVVPCGMDGRRVIVRKIALPRGGYARLARRYIPGTVLDNPIYANDPLYLAQLATLPETLRRQLLYGDWDAGSGAALDELDEAVHFVRPFRVPPEWVHFGALDLGYAHWSAFVWLVVTEDGDLYVIDTVWARRMKPRFFAERLRSRVPVDRLAYIDTDTFPMQERKDRSDTTPSIAEEYLGYGIPLRQGNTDRKKGLTNLRYYLAWRGQGPEGEDGQPALRFFDTRGNRRLFEQCQAMVTDEDDPEDVLKVDCDPETGVGGDDGYDALRYAVASRPPRPIGQFYRGTVRAFSKETLHYMTEILYRDRDLPDPLAQEPGLYTYLSGV
jgi:phage terminase large subunit